jgi:hypothetical protein
MIHFLYLVGFALIVSAVFAAIHVGSAKIESFMRENASCNSLVSVS